MMVGSLFSGVGMFDLAAERVAGWIIRRMLHQDDLDT